VLSGFVPLTLLFWGVFRVFLAKMKGTAVGTLYIVVSMYHSCMLHHWQHGVKIGYRNRPSEELADRADHLEHLQYAGGGELLVLVGGFVDRDIEEGVGR